MSTAVSGSMLAHGLHDVMVLLGLWGLAALLVPHALDRISPPHPGPDRDPHDEHEVRVVALRAAVAAGVPGLAVPVGPHGTGAASPPAPTRRAPAVGLPLALVATAAAAGIHAAVAPPHLREGVFTGLVFVVAAVAQASWAVAAQRPTDRLLRAGIVLHVGLVTVWLWSRATGLHAVGAWDLVCVAWEVVAIAACARTLRDGVPPRCPSWWDWHPTTRAAVGAALCSLTLLTLVGGHA